MSSGTIHIMHYLASVRPFHARVRARVEKAIWIADAHRDNGKRFVVRAHEKLTAFTELESEINYTSVSVTTLPFQRSLQ
jgi:hypothetical protein